MPTIIPSPGTAPAATHTSGFWVDSTYIVAAGQTMSFEGGGFYFRGTSPGRLVNDGTIWARTNGDFALAIVGGTANDYSIPFDNHGLIVAETVGIFSQVYYAGSWAGPVTNSGRMFALSTGGNAIAIYSWSPDHVITNSGLIAASSDIYAGGGIWLQNGGKIINEAGGEILAEGWAGTAISMGIGSTFSMAPSADVVNRGRIEAASHEGGQPSVGIRVASYGAREFVNSGTIKADIAILADSYFLSPPFKAPEIVTNEAGGLIIGLIDLQLGDDRVVNRGTIRGDLLMDEGSDLVDTTGGTIEGVAFMGWGDDRFIGGAGHDRAVGDRGADRLEGGDGNDLLLGGQGDDRIEGGLGNDGLFGEYGADHIVAAGGDWIDGGEGDDRIELRDLAFARIDGGAGDDRLVLATGARSLDLSLVVAAQTVHSIEQVELTGDQRLVLRAGDASALSGDASLTLVATASDRIELVGVWAEQAGVNVDGAAHRRFTLSGEAVLITGDGMVTVTSAPSAPAGGLDPAAGGPAAPTPTASDGTGLVGPVTIANGWAINDDLSIDAYETWQSEGGRAVLASWDWNYDIVNHGRIVSSNNAGNAQAVNTQNLWSLQNHGLISAIASNGGTAEAFYSGSWGKTFNYGRIEAISDTGFAAAVTQWESSHRSPVAFVNEGEIYARTGGTQRAVGTFLAYGGNAYNHGSIEATGGDGTLGLYSGSDFNFINTGSIIATLAVGASGMTTAIHAAAAIREVTITNTGLIRAQQAIFVDSHSDGPAHIANGGTIDGSVILGTGIDTFENRGTVTGDVRFGGSTDLWLGATGVHNGTVFGEAGDDLLFGSVHNDVIDGGEGDDLIKGGLGLDRLSGGAGADRFVYAEIGDSTATAPDVISGFETGVDRIDLSALAPSAVTFAPDGDSTLLTVQTAGGFLVIKVQGAISQSDLLLAPEQSPAASGAADLLIAPTAGGTLDGLGGADRLVGGNGSDRLDGGAGDDVMWGGAGDDTYVVNTYSDAAWEFSDQGFDTVEVGGDFDTHRWFYWAPEHVERLVLRGFAYGHGNAGDNVIIGGDGGTGLKGGAGNDVLIGGLGDDALFGDAGADLYVYLSAADSTAAAMDRIFGETGIDIVDLIALGPVGIRLDRIAIQYEVPYTLATIGTAAGTMVIRFDEPIALTDFDYIAGGQSLFGTAGPDDVHGYNTNDSLFLHHGGNDRARGDAGNDGFYFGANLNSIDVVEGGSGTDTLALQGVYSGVDNVLRNVAEIEVLALLPGDDGRFVTVSGDPTSYVLASVDGNVAAGGTLTVIGSELRADEDLIFNGAAETDGRFRIFAGQGTDTLTGGSGSDGFFFGADGNLTGADRVAGGGGTDSIALRGNYVGGSAVVFQDASFSSVEVLTFLSGHTNEFGGVINSDGFDYDVTLANGTIAAGQRLDVIAGNLRSNESVRVDARGELDGAVRIISGAGDDLLFGSAGNDILSGGLGADVLDGSGGGDSYVYRSTGESTGASRDTIAFGSGDKIDLSLIDANGGTAPNESFSFIGAAPFSNVAGQLRAVQAGDQWIVEGDVNGDGVADLAIAVAGGVALVVSDFIL